MMTFATTTAMLLCLALLFSTTTVQAQRSIDATTIRALDTALAVIGMRMSDVTMPADMIDADRHRTLFHDRLFVEPLFAVDFSTRMSELFESRGYDSIRMAVSELMTAMELGQLSIHPYEGRISADDVLQALGGDPTQRMNSVNSFIAIRFLSAVVQANDAITTARRNLLRSDAVVNHMDSMWMLDHEDESSSLWDIAAREKIGRANASTFFSEAAPRICEDIYSHGLSLYVQLRTFMEQVSRNDTLLVDSVKTTTFRTPFGRVAIGGPGDDVYEGSYAVIVDVGGNDIYRLDDTTKADALARPIRCIVDFNGNDVYLGGSYSYGAGIGGIGILIDRTGHDTYLASDFSLGCGLFGFGVLHDMAGNDTYASGVNSQGAGIFGIGLLLDDAGHDTYRCHAQSQAFGGTRGCGVLSDNSGNDRYIAASPFVDVLRYDAHQVTFVQGAALGSRPIASGGIGLLADVSGNDTYVSDIYGQGTGYWFGLGALVDGTGDDRYQSYQYAQGSGVHFASGVLRDKSGEDVYVSHGVSMGCGHDIATGILMDESGNDVYVTESLSLGAGNANAISIFVDRMGNDAYSASNVTNTLGYSDMRRSYGMIGLFVDMSGNDVYGEATRNNTTNRKSTYGAFIDGSFVPEPSPTPSPSPTTAFQLTTSVDSLFVQASASALRYQSAVAPARKRLGELGTEALTFFETVAGTSMPRERITLETSIPLIYATHQDSTVSLLSRLLDSDDGAQVALACTIAGKVKCAQLVRPLIIATRDTSWKRRRLAAHTLGEIGDTSASMALINLLTDSHPYVRQRAAYALGMFTPSHFARLHAALTDDDQIVRHAAVEGLLRGPKLPAESLTSWYRSITDRATMVSAIKLLAVADTADADVASVQRWRGSCPTWVNTILLNATPELPAFWRDTLMAGGTVKKKKKKKQ